MTYYVFYAILKKIKENEVIHTARKRSEEVAENAIVQKSRPLFSLWQEKFSLFEYKLLDLYLGHINSHDSSTKTVIMTKAELEQAIGLKRMNSNDLDSKLRNLMRIVDIDTGSKYPLHVSLFETCYLNYETEPYQVEMQCTNSAFELIFNIDKIGYFKYKLRCILNIDSLYSYILFNYIEYNRYRMSWEVNIDELKAILNCNSPTYDTFKRFNDLILKKCHTELTQKTELRYNYSTVKRGRKVIAIKFSVEPLLAENIQEPESANLIELALATDQRESEPILNSDVQTILDLYPTFTVTDIKAIYNRIVKLQPDKGAYGTARVDYFKSVYDDVKRQEQKNGTKINDYAAYIIAMLDKRLQAGDVE